MKSFTAFCFLPHYSPPSPPNILVQADHWTRYPKHQAIAASLLPQATLWANIDRASASVNYQPFVTVSLASLFLSRSDSGLLNAHRPAFSLASPPLLLARPFDTRFTALISCTLPPPRLALAADKCSSSKSRAS